MLFYFEYAFTHSSPLKSNCLRRCVLDACPDTKDIRVNKIGRRVRKMDTNMAALHDDTKES